jgi:hypothetical protein
MEASPPLNACPRKKPTTRHETSSVPHPRPDCSPNQFLPGSAASNDPGYFVSAGRILTADDAKFGKIDLTGDFSKIQTELKSVRQESQAPRRGCIQRCDMQTVSVRFPRSFSQEKGHP